MAEAAGFVLGAIPILIEVIKAYNSTYNTLHSMRHYSREVERIRKQYERQKQFFENECHLLLKSALPASSKDTDAMVDNLEHRLWTENSLIRKVDALLKNNRKLGIDIASDIRATLEDVKSHLRCFDVVERQSRPDESITNTVRRIRQSLKIGFEKSQYDKLLRTLRDHNADFRLLISQVVTLEQKTLDFTEKTSSHNMQTEESDTLDTVRRASDSLYHDIQSIWSCSRGCHVQHSAGLYLQSKVENVVEFSLALYRHYQYQLAGDSEPQAQRFRIRSSRALIKPPISTPQSSPASSQVSTITERHSYSTRRYKRKHGSDQSHTAPEDQQRELTPPTTPTPKARRRVPANAPNLTLLSTISNMLELNQVDDLCQHMEKNAITPSFGPWMPITSGTTPFGYVESNHGHRHTFYSEEPELSNQRRHRLRETLKSTVAATLNVRDQIRLAHALVIAVLKYGSTPWLSRDWSLDHIWFFGDQCQLSNELINHLHLVVDLIQDERSDSVTMDNNPQATTIPLTEEVLEDALLLHGIRDLTLYNLGVCPMQIGQWEVGDSYDVVGVRRVVAGSVLLGPRYQRLVRKCLNCDFGRGEDLQNRALQKALYNDVVRPLDEMMQALDLES